MNKNLTKISSLLTAVAIVMVIFYTAVILVSFNILTPQLYFFIAWSASAIVVTLCLWLAVEIFSRAHDPINECSLHNALSLTSTRAVELMENGANPNAIDEYGNTPLHLAAKKGYTETVAALIENGAIINTSNQDGYTPQRYAEEAGQIRTALAIMNAGKALVNSVTTVFPFFPNDVTALILEFSGVLHKKINLDDVVDCRRELTNAATAG